MSDAGPEHPPPGWYADPHGEQRWWDGHRWTEHTLPAPAARGVDSALVVGALVLGVVLLLALTGLNVVLLAR